MVSTQGDEVMNTWTFQHTPTGRGHCFTIVYHATVNIQEACIVQFDKPWGLYTINKMSNLQKSIFAYCKVFHNKPQNHERIWTNTLKRNLYVMMKNYLVQCILSYIPYLYIEMGIAALTHPSSTCNKQTNFSICKHIQI